MTRLVLAYVLAATTWLTTTAQELEVGDTVCVEGFVMDFFCIERGTLFDRRSVRTLEGPEQHSVHCLIDVGSCISTPFEILSDPSGDETLYSRGWRMDQPTKDTVVQLAKETGICTDCFGSGSLVRGFRVAMNATVVDLGDGVNTPPTITLGENVPVPSVMGSNEMLCGASGLTAPINRITNSGGSSIQKKIYAHAACMLIGWGFLLPLGVAFAKLFRHRGSVWYDIHRACQYVGLVLSLVGFVIALQNFDVFQDKGHDNYKHGVMGCATMALGLIQPLNALLRPHAPEEGEEKSIVRFAWEMWHKSTGYSAIILSIATIIFGTRLLPKLDDQDTFQLAYGIGCAGAILLVSVALIVDKKIFFKPAKKDLESSDEKDSEYP